MSEKLKEVCAYIRVSTDKQEELSPESQIRLIKDYAEQHNMLLTRCLLYTSPSHETELDLV